MAGVEVNPGYRALLGELRLQSPDDFLALPGVVYCGHADRHVVRVAFGENTAFLKREHRIHWQDRLANALAGFGFCSKARREFHTLQAVAKAGIGCAMPVAVGEDGRGRAFLLLREVGGHEIRAVLKRAPAPLRRRLAVQLGEEVARIHDAGFDHPDLYSKHIRVANQPDGDVRFYFLDWQRSRQRARVRWAIRCRDLAALDATLAEDLATSRDRLAFLHAYLGGTRGIRMPRLAAAARLVRSRAERLLRKRRVRELRQPPLAWGRQNLVWIQGEALCVTREFQAELRGHLPAWLTSSAAQPGVEVARTLFDRTGGRHGLLIRRQQSRPLRWFRAWLRRRRLLRDHHAAPAGRWAKAPAALAHALAVADRTAFGDHFARFVAGRSE